MVDYKHRVLETRGCPRCGVRRGERCISGLTNTAMVNQIHPERMKALRENLATLAGERSPGDLIEH